MTASKLDTKPTWTDPDDAPELTDEWFEGATLHENGVVKRLPGQRGPGKKRPKESVTLRLDPDVLEHFREGGDGWQTRINNALRATMMAKRRQWSRGRTRSSQTPRKRA